MVFRRLPGVYADQLPLSPVDYAIGRFDAKLQLFILQVNMLLRNFFYNFLPLSALSHQIRFLRP
ncbi:hypothetical protein EEL40_02130 [Muribaculaceae bacterium Isolate-083 (Janvier)]|nr:hypothetical protein EEL40_02130 [Muribaculaceae bacterium Isolate-083 (Janvier)]